MDSSGVIRTVLGTAQILVVEVGMRYATGFHGGKIVVFLFWRMEHGITKNNNMLFFFQRWTGMVGRRI